MKKTLQTLLASAFLVMPLSAFSKDNEFAAGDLTLKGLWARVTLQNLPAAAFVTIHNSGNADKIVDVSSLAAERVEMHTHLNENGVMKMRQINDIDVPANSVTELKSGGSHLMIFKLKTLFKPGDMIPLTITFEKAGTVDVRATVKSMKPMKMDHNNTSTN